MNKQKHKLIRIFISSTFCDFEKERNIINSQIAPKLSDYCQKNGYSLQFVDLRWGVPENAEKERDTMNICLQELERCMVISPSSYMFIMMGNRYGWQPIPEYIYTDDFNKLMLRLEGCYIGINKIDARAIFEKWYKLDTNSLPHIYRLTRIDNADEWKKDEKILRSILQESYDDVEFSALGKAEYFNSATGREIAEGAFSHLDNDKKAVDKPVVCFFRNFKGAKNFTDVDFDKMKAVEQLKDKISKEFKEFNCKISVENYGYKAYYKNFTVKTEKLLKSLIDHRIQKYKESSSVDSEDAEHWEFCEERAKVFFGRGDEIEKCKKFLAGDKPLMIIHGQRGVGKSAFFAKLLDDLRKKENSALLVARFVGTTARSNDIFIFLSDLCETLWYKLRDKTDFPKPDSYGKAIELFSNILHYTQEKNIALTLVIDALDQFGKQDYMWLPKIIPNSVKLILGTQSNEYLDNLKSHFPEDSFSEIEIKELDGDTSRNILNKWLELSKRVGIEKLAQKDKVESVISDKSLAIYLKVLFEKIKKWRSYDEVDELEQDVDSMIKSYLFNELGKISHGIEFVSRALAYIDAGENGVSELELLELLRRDNVAFKEIVKRSHNKISSDIKTIPFMVWARLYGDIEPYLKEISHYNQLQLSFFHEQIADSVRSFNKDIVDEINSLMLSYFKEQLDAKKYKISKLRVLSSVPYHTKLQDNCIERMSNLLMYEKYLDEKYDAELLSQLIDEYEWLIKNSGDSDNPNNVVECLFVYLARKFRPLDIKKKKDAWEKVHTLMIFRFDRRLHKLFFEIGTNMPKLKSLLKDFTDEELEYINITCLIKKFNYLRRTGKIYDALKMTFPNDSEIPCELKSGVFYEMGYTNYLAGKHDLAWENMTKSIDSASQNEMKVFTKLVQLFIGSRSKLFTDEYEQSVANFMPYLNEAIGVFSSSDCPENAQRFLANVYEYSNIIGYYKGDSKATENALNDFKKEPTVIASSDTTREQLATAMQTALSENYSLASEKMENLIQYKISQVSMNEATDDENSKILLVESIGQMYYLLYTWSKECDKKETSKNALEKLEYLATQQDNGNHIWTKQALTEANITL